MGLIDLSFSDLFIMPDGSGRLKGCPGTEQLLVPVPPDCEEEIRDLPTLLVAAVLDNKKHHGKNSRSKFIRFPHRGIYYRVADMFNVNDGRTWFLRRLADRVPLLPELNLPSYLCPWLLSEEQQQGLILFSGAQASGKTTTASSFVATRLSLFGGHAVTFENPAELPLDGDWGDHGHCFQSDLPDEQELSAEIEVAHRYASPNLVYIGEIRTKYAALEALRVALGSNRQIVVATIHGLDIVAALIRLSNWAKELDGTNAMHNLASSLLGVIHQELITDEQKHRVLNISQFLLLPFKDNSMIKGMRAKLREGQLHTLTEDIRAQRNSIAHP